MNSIFVNPNAKINQHIPNMSLAYAATHFNAKVIDLNTRPNPKNRFLKDKSDILGLSIQSRTLTEARKISKMYKKKYPRSKIVSVNTDIDVQCCYPFLSFGKNLLFDKTFSDKYPFPNYELFDSFDIFLKNWQSNIWSYPIMTSLGCPGQCIYCSARLRRYKPRSVKNCYEELKQAKDRWKIKSFEILDDLFNFDKNRVLEFCDLVKELNLKWYCVNGLRADMFDEDIAEAMSESGCEYVGFGIESVNPEVLLAIKKGETIEQIDAAVNVAKQYFKSVNGYFIIGLPRSTYEKDLASLRWALKKKINAHFSFFVPPNNRSDSLFYGETAKPLSDEYPKELQLRIFRMTEYMREINRKNIIPKVITSFKNIITYDTGDLHLHFISGIERIWRKIV